MKKIISALMALTITLCGVSNYSASAENDEIYYMETLNETIVCVVPEENTEISSESLGVTILKQYTMDIEENTNITRAFDYCDEPVVNINNDNDSLEENEQYVYSIDLDISDKDSIKKLKENPDIKEVYYLVNVTRTTVENGEWPELLSSVYRRFNAEDIVLNDANSDGVVNSEDALRVLEAITGSTRLTLQEKIQVGMRECLSNGQNDTVTNHYATDFTAGKALEILEQTVGLR